MDNEEILKNILQEDIPEQYQPVVSLIGLDAFLKLCRYGCGTELYFPMQETILRKARNRMIIQAYNGYNIAELARKYGLTPQSIKYIIKGSNSA